MPVSHEYRTEIVRSLFQGEVALGRVQADFGCANGSYTGRMYVCQRGLCFYSNLFGFERKFYVLWRDIVEIQNYRTSGIVVRYLKGSDKDEHVFKSIMKNRDEVFELLNKFLIDNNQETIGVNMIEDEIGISFVSPKRERTDGLYIESRQSTPKKQVIMIDTTTIENVDEMIDRSSSSQSPYDNIFDNTSENLPLVPVLLLYNGLNEGKLLSQCAPSDLNNAWNQFKSLSEQSFKEVALKGAELPALTLNSFYRKFLDDDAECSMSDFHNQIGDIVKETTKWKLSDDSFCRTRVIYLDHPVVGYGKAQTTKYQCCRIFGESGIVVDSFVTSKGLPAVDCFHVEERIFIEAKPDGGLLFTALYQIVWNKSSILKSIATRSAKHGTMNFYEEYILMINRTDLSGLPSIIVDLKKEQKDEIQQSEQTRALLYFVLLSTVLLFASIGIVYRKVNELEVEIAQMTEQIQSIHRLTITNPLYLLQREGDLSSIETFKALPNENVLIEL